MMSSSSVVTTIVAPLFGVIIVNIMWSSPYPAIVKARKNVDLGNLNPLPFFTMVFNCIGWLIYSFQKRDYFIFFGNCGGLALGCFYSLTAVRLLGRKDDIKSINMVELCEYTFVFIVGFWSFMGLIAAIAYGPTDYDRTQATIMIGILCDVASISYYAAPLSTMLEVIKFKDSSSLYAPAITMNFTNGSLWFIYGLTGTHDLLLWVPNLLGALFALSQLILIFLYKKDTFLNIILGRKSPSVQNYSTPDVEDHKDSVSSSSNSNNQNKNSQSNKNQGSKMSIHNKIGKQLEQNSGMNGNSSNNNSNSNSNSNSIITVGEVEYNEVVVNPLLL